MGTDDPEDEGRWHMIHSQLLLALLTRAFAGEHPDLLYVELMANTTGYEPDEDAE